jgi:transposase
VGGVRRGNDLAYKYTSFCVKYRAWAAGLKRSMRQTHIAGEKLFVDYAGQTVPIVDAATGEITRAQIFVAVLGASNYTYACATPAPDHRRLDRRASSRRWNSSAACPA